MRTRKESCPNCGSIVNGKRQLSFMRKTLTSIAGKAVKTTFTLCLLVFFCTNSYAVEKTVDVQKPGGLKKLINKKEYLDITSLTIKGTINDKDMKAIENLQNLVSVDMSMADGTFYYFPTFPKLEKLILSPRCSDTFKKVGDKNIYLSDCISSNKSIRFMCMSGSVANKIHDMPNLKKVELYDAEYQGHDKNIKSLKIDTLIIRENKGTINRSLELYPELYERMAKKNSFAYQEVEDNYYYAKSVYNGLRPRIIVNKKSGEIILNAYEPNRTNYSGINILPILEEGYGVRTPQYLDLSDVHVIPAGYFANCTMRNIKLSKKLRYVGVNAFYGCNGLVSVKFPGDNQQLNIDGWCFNCCSNLKDIHFCGPVNCDLNKRQRYYFYGNHSVVTFDKPSSITGKDFTKSPFDHIVFNALPIEFEVEKIDELANYIEFAKGIQQQFLNRYTKYASFSDKCFDKCGKLKSYNINLEKPGTILSYLPMDKLDEIDSLTITGLLYETDVNVIQKCRRLSYLDLGRTIITYSPELYKEEEDRSRAFAALLGISAAMASEQFANGSIDQFAMKQLAEVILGAASSVTEANQECFIPYGKFRNMILLKTVILPYSAWEIGDGAFSGCINLERVELPPFLKSIGNAFNYCEKLKDIKFPSTLEKMDEGFYKCNSLEFIDLSLCDFGPKTDSKRDRPVKWPNAFRECSNIKGMILPQGITKIKCLDFGAYNNENSYTLLCLPKSLKEIEDPIRGNWALHFKSEVAPRIRFGDQCQVTIYCPKGCTTSYFNAIGGKRDNIKIIEE